MRNSSNFPQEGQEKPNVDKFMSADVSGDLLAARLCSKPVLGFTWGWLFTWAGLQGMWGRQNPFCKEQEWGRSDPKIPTQVILLKKPQTQQVFEKKSSSMAEGEERVVGRC